MSMMSSKYKNIIVINDFDYAQGGASTVAIETANGLVEQGLNVVFFSVVHSDNTTLDTRIKNVTLSGKEALQYDNKIVGMMTGIINKECQKELSLLLNNYSPEDTIIHIHGWTKACSSVVFSVARNMGFKIVLTLHEYFSTCPNGAFLNYKNNKCCNLVPCSYKCFITNCDSRNYMFKLYRYIREKKYYRDINLSEINCIFVSELQKEIISKYKKINVSEIICSPIEELDKEYKGVKLYDFAYIGRDSREKGISLFVKLCEVMPDRKFLIVGNYSGKKSSNLSVTGWVSEKKVEHYLKDSKCLVVPSLLPEPFGLVVVKAVAFGIKCLVSDNIGAADYVNSKTGLVFEQGNFEDLKVKAREIEKISNIECKDVLISKEDYIHRIIEFYNKD